MAVNISVDQYNLIMFRRLITALHEEHGLAMRTAANRYRGHYQASAHNNTRTIVYKLAGLKPKMIESVRKDRDNMTRYIQTGEKRPIRFEEPGNGVLLIEVPKLGKHWEQVTVDTLKSRRYLRDNTLKLALGLGHQDRPMMLDFSQPQSSTVGVFGQTQSGKTNTVRLLIWETIMSDMADVILADVGLREKNFGVFNGATALAHPLIVDPADGYNLLVWLKNEIHRRASSTETQKPLFVFLDEVQTFVDYTSVHGDSAKLLSDVTRQCIQVGIKLVVSTQLAQIGLIGKALNNLQIRICHKVDKAASSTAALGVKNAGAEGLLGFGDCLYRPTEGLHRMSVARLDESKDAELYDRIERGGMRRLPLGQTTVESVAQDVPDAPHPSQAPDELDYGQIASVVFEPAGINKLQKRFAIGSTKAKRLQAAAREIRAYAYHHDLSLPTPDEDIIEAVEGQSYNWLSSDWEEV